MSLQKNQEKNFLLLFRWPETVFSKDIKKHDLNNQLIVEFVKSKIIIIKVEHFSKLVYDL